jgi:asparagine synthase (glutamine-hydrolysing)
LFYASCGKNVLLSPSVETLLKHPRVPVALNRAALADHLCDRWPRPEETYFEAVNRVPPGHVLRFSLAGLDLFRYWDPAPSVTSETSVREDELERFDGLLEQAVRRCMGLGGTGIYLSGGIDSAAGAATAAGQGGDTGFPRPWALSLAFPDARGVAEVLVQREVAAKLGLPQLMVGFDEAVGPKGLLRPALDISGTMPAPLLTRTEPAFRHLGIEGRSRGCRVVMTGGGGDEWLAVSPFFAADLMAKLDFPGLIRLVSTTHRSYQRSRFSVLQSVLWTFGARVLLRAAARRALSAADPAVSRSYYQRRLIRETPSWIAPDPALRRTMVERAEQRMSAEQPAEYYARELKLGLDHPLVSMRMEERFESGRQIGLQILNPFWDADLVEFLYRVSPAMKNRGGRSKALIRPLLAREIPGLGLERQRKVEAFGFYRAIDAAEGASAWEAMGGTSALGALGVVDERALRSAVEFFLLAPLTNDSFRLWHVLNHEAWTRSHM